LAARARTGEHTDRMTEGRDVDLRGTWFVLPTAFEEDGRFDADGQRRVVEAAVSWGVDGLLTLGLMGEAPALTDVERTEVLRTVIEASAGRTPVAVGCSGPAKRIVADRIREAADMGAAAVMISAPPLARDTDGVPVFFERAAAASPVPIIVQDEPVATGTFLPVSLLLRCVEASGALAVKLEDPPTPPKVAALLAARPELRVFGGLGGVSALGELRRGACGTMTGFSYPEALTTVRTRMEAGDREGAAATFDRYLPLIAFEGQPVVGLGIRKEILRRRGALPRGTTRGALVPDTETLAELDEVLRRVGLMPSLERLVLH
jgi:4-hydroxy-tetrahydrodipicolinate synthase